MPMQITMCSGESFIALMYAKIYRKINFNGLLELLHFANTSFWNFSYCTALHTIRTTEALCDTFTFLDPFKVQGFYMFHYCTCLWVRWDLLWLLEYSKFPETFPSVDTLTWVKPMGFTLLYVLLAPHTTKLKKNFKIKNTFFIVQ